MVAARWKQPRPHLSYALSDSFCSQPILGRLSPQFTAAANTMSLGSWDPNAGSQSSDLQLTPDLLKRLIGYAANEQLDQLEQILGEKEDEQLARLMQIDHALWRSAVEDFSEEDILQLIRFFAVAENLPGWEAGATSPVIPLAKVLRKRGAKLDKTLLQWLREVNENRYLPYGPL